uniref:Uncharacterized protein n=1 Tax=candidate division CPR3 bacterium TaxID=2268181 RepID=A0A7C4M2L7_UNCC3
MTRVADDVLGKLTRQQHDIFRRVRESSLPVEKVLLMHKKLIGGNIIVKMNGRGCWGKMIGNCGCEERIISSTFNQEEIPPLPKDQQDDVEITISKKISGITTSNAWQEILKNCNRKFVHPMVLLALGEDEPDEQKDYKLFTIWKDKLGKLWFLCLGMYDGRRSLHIGDCYLGFRWSENCRAVGCSR